MHGCKGGYKVQKDGIAYINEDGQITKFKHKNGDIFSYRNGKIVDMRNSSMSISYHNYDENIIESITNKTDEEILVKANEQDFKIKPKGSIGFYDNNQLKYIADNEVFTSYYEDGNIRSIGNYASDNINVNVTDNNDNIYILNSGDYIKFYKTGNIEKIKQGKLEKTYYRYNDSDYYYVRNYDDGSYTFYHNEDILLKIDEKIEFTKETFEKDGITRIVLEDGTIVDEIVPFEKSDDVR